MNKENYKAIARIIRECFIANFISDDYTKGYQLAKNNIGYSLADYFEKEAGYYEDNNHKIQRKFNKGQFLKDCGVKNDI